MNEKVEHKQLWCTIRRADNDQCVHCNAAIETLKHKFNECPRVAAAWEHLQNVLMNILNGRRISFEQMLHPELHNTNRTQRLYAMKHIINYVAFVNKCDNRVDVDELEFYLNVEL